MIDGGKIKAFSVCKYAILLSKNQLLIEKILRERYVFYRLRNGGKASRVNTGINSITTHNVPPQYLHKSF
jgi:hypothetical protein